MSTHCLFLCSYNKLRSRTAERIYKDNEGLEVRSAGVRRDAETQVTREMMEWADIVFVMERTHRNLLHSMFRDLYDSKKIVCLYIPDEYDFMDPVLVRLLGSRLTRYIGPPARKPDEE